MKKIYTIRITSAQGKPNIWYASKIGRDFEAELVSKVGSTAIVFYVNPCQFVYPIDCEVVSERIVETFIKTVN
jgi:hypothetical protein